LSPLTTNQRLLALFGAIAVIMAAGIVGSVASRPAMSERASGTIAVASGTETCGAGWTEPHAGLSRFAVHNTTIAGEEVYLEGAKNQLVYAELEGLGAGATHELSAVLANGSYRFVCLPADLPAAYGPVVTITKQHSVANPTPGVKIVTAADLIVPDKQYHAWVAGQLPILAADVLTLERSVAAGDIVAAKAAWLSAHLEYESLGAAYGAFGDLDAAINGVPRSGLTALTDPNLTGFHRIEAQLWSGAAPQAIAPTAEALMTDVARLQSAFATAQIPPLDIGLRSHEILENAIQFELTGATDAGSETNIATIGANLVGTREALAPLEPLLATRYPALASTKSWLDRAAAIVQSYHRPDGSWTPLPQLTRPQRQALNAALDESVQLLAPVATITDPRLAPQ
jgi:iron uptake system component EfeO